MNMTETQEFAMRLALEALETPIHEQAFMQRQAAIVTLKAALAEPVQEPVQEPVAYSYHPCTFILIEALKEFPNGKEILAEWDEARAKVDALQADPPQRPTAGATYSDVVSDSGMDPR